MREICFTTFAFEEYNEWLFENKKIQQRVKKLITECVRTPFEGTGKPEALKHVLKGYWSRRITDEHRLVYKVSDDMITIISCRDHYGDK
jgi:toxin YoeB